VWSEAELAAWQHWVKTGEGPPRFNTAEPPLKPEHKLLVSVKPKQAQAAQAKPAQADDAEYEEAAKILGDGFTAEDARRLHELFRG
jgi:hypothetical protein